MTQEEHDRIVANCAKLRGWEKKLRLYVPESPIEPAEEIDYWHDGEVYTHACRDYDPTTNILQANELWNELESKSYSVELCSFRGKTKATIKLYNSTYDWIVVRVGRAVAEKWNSALAAAVSALCDT